MFFDRKRPNFGKILLIPILFFLSCRFVSDSETVKNTIDFDLTRLLKTAELACTGDTEKSIETFRSHWKKNPGRYSGLASKERWKNVQTTLYVDETLFINESQDSLFVPSGAECSLKLDGSYFAAENRVLRFNEAGISGPGTLRISWNGIEIFNRSFEGIQEEWNGFAVPVGSFDVKKENVLTIGWNSPRGSGVFLGSPIIFKKSKTKKHNVILIVVDAMRQDALSSAGSPVLTTPVLDRLSENSIVFKNTFSNGNWTKPSMISFFTSEIASNLGLGNAWFYTSASQRKIFYSKRPETLPNLFRQNGYFTESIMNNVFLLDYTSVGVDLGFHNIQQVGKDTLDTEELVLRSEKFFRDHREDLFFLHLNLNTPHWGYRPPERFMKSLESSAEPDLWKSMDEYQRKYLGEIRYTDALLGRIFEELKRQNLFEDSWIVITSDHGELLEKTHYYHHHFITETVYAHGETHYEKEIRVPWIIHPPESIRERIKKTEFTGQVSLLSLAPTLLGLNGIPFPREKLKGNDYSSAVFGKEGPESESVVYTEGRFSESIRTADYKYLRRYPGYDTVRRTREGVPHKMPEELYDLRSDPGETKNLVFENSTLLKEARELLGKNRLSKNEFVLRLPKCVSLCDREIRMFVKGGIYRYELDALFETIQEDSKNLTLRISNVSSSGDRELRVQTVDPNPSFRLQILKDGKTETYRVGKWGIVSSAAEAVLASDPDYVSLGRIPYRYSSSDLPFLYYHTGFAGGTETPEEAAMGKEVRKVLESWGYIHQ
ncbi:sulfatase [Leptospira gomenensis]|uniref:Sulfatase n=1 Tax=Leptospira gomenensis TaxID=2484974 RepID=A0A5F1YL06_9LEPT|nr:sulfatase [Leptospira gomenensis]TGK33371.1 sulfatase [Leptospira gomenensis]TGK37334.1 sulfatase [Leptospira gomenensis]TGK40523.1 sulfatase [Leptospira gomenensis]TGK56445.1 sulfatase [Leptospira gomenensis]